MTTATAASPSKRKRLLLIATLIFIVIGLLWFAWWAIFVAHSESTDDAYVHGNLVQITSQIPGTVIAIHADDTSQVEKGSLLIQLDPSDTDIALSQSKSALAQAVRHTRTVFVQNQALQADIAMRKADIQSVNVDLAKAQNDLQRRQALARSGGVSGEEILHAQTAVKASQSALLQAQAALAASVAKLETNQALTSNTTIATHPDVLQAADQLRKAWLASSRTQLPAPVDGMVAQRSVQVGQHVAAGTPLVTLVPLHQLWVEANFKENQVRHMLPGQNVTLTSDLYGGDVVFRGKVEGIAAGTGSAFALLPAQNASGNWIKIIQRVPVRIALDPEQFAEHPLRVGLSMNAKVDLSDGQDMATYIPDGSRLQTAVFTDNDNGKAVDTLIATIIQANSGS
ncbi:MAG: HlyD family efflux transporter periplasmic adaptor subunit [Burkholderiaceae bacterium]|nr:HlyD family efflux transporter periplasmic adaptor subunit [Burkholderiaceae bacterium]